VYGRINPESVAATDVSFFSQSFLTQVCLGVSDIILNFNRPNISITTQAGFQCIISGEILKHPVEEGHLLRPFLNQDVVSAKWAEMGTLVISFEGGDEIHLLDDTDQFESFTVTHAGNTIVV
jgi:hypothetical protein